MRASSSVSSHRWLLATCLSLVSVLGTGQPDITGEVKRYTCKTFGSGVYQPFNDLSFYVRSDCLFTLLRFTHNDVECDITARRDDSGLLVQVEIIINKIRTVLQNGSILVEDKRISLPYDHTFQHIFRYGIYTRLRSTLLPLSVTWHNVPGGIDSLWVDLDQELSTSMTGLCTKTHAPGNEHLISEIALAEDTCNIRDPVSIDNEVCSNIYSLTLGCLHDKTEHYLLLCKANIHGFEKIKSISCSFFKEIALLCGPNSFIWSLWRGASECEPPECPGDLQYKELGAPFVPSCSNPNPKFFSQDLISSCLCPEGKVLNEVAEGFHCVDVSSCSCEFAGKTYTSGEKRSTKCYVCVCSSGKWQCSENSCPARCSIKGHVVTTFDGKHYTLPGKCSYVASQGLNWRIIAEFSAKAPSMKMITLEIFQETYKFSHNMVTVGGQEISELHMTDKALVYWQSSMYVQVDTSVGINIQVQMSPDIQLYIKASRNYTDKISGLCGNNNKDTTDDFTTSSEIVETSAQLFALSWSVGDCAVNIPPSCIKTENEIFAADKCSVLNDPNGIFAECNVHIQTDHYYKACIQTTCNCGNNMQQCLCVALGCYAKACVDLGIVVGDWRKATNCVVECPNNQEFFYNISSCNQTCRSLSGLDPRCELEDEPVEGCGCPEGTHLSQEHICTPMAECNCYYNGGTTPPGSSIIYGQKCSCENGKLNCTKDCGCREGKICVHCIEDPVNTANKTCDSLSRPTDSSLACESGCYCPPDQYEDHHGNCTSLDGCTCVYSGKVFAAGQTVKTKCKTCICGQARWHCEDEPCPGRCQVYGNGHYQTFDSKWYRFSGHCQYTLVEDDCGDGVSTFSITVESVPCCDEALTCSRSIMFDLQGKVTLILNDMKVTRIDHVGGMQEGLLYSIHSVGLNIIISVPSKGITLIWDKHTRITVELSAIWRNKVCGLCGNFDSNEMNDLQTSNSTVTSSPMTFGNSWKAATPPCSDVTAEIFPCKRNAYCSSWAERRCMIITGDTFKDCHFKVDPEPYFIACVQESCSCEFEGKFLGFCTAVAAYAEACRYQHVCVDWRTPDLCPVYCDYYNDQGQCSWHYEACGRLLTCKGSLTHKLEGCYPRCSEDAPYYDENTGECTTLRHCTCYFNNTVIQPEEMVWIRSKACWCENGTVYCSTPSTTAATTKLSTTSTPSTTVETTVLSTTSTTYPTTADTTVLSTTSTTYPTTAETTVLSTTSTTYPTTADTTVLSTTSTTYPTTAETTVLSTTSTTYPTTAETTVLSTTSTTYPTTAETTVLSTTSTTYPTTAETTVLSTTSTTYATTVSCECKDPRRNESWYCNETWVEDCYIKTCKNGEIEMTPQVCPEPTIPNCPRQQVTSVRDGCCETLKCNCRCDVFGDPHYITFQGLYFDFMDNCTYTLVEERSPRHYLMIAVDNFNCAEPPFSGSCNEKIILKYGNNTATLKITSQFLSVEATLNNMTIEPPYEEHGLRFETTGYEVFIYLPEIRSYVSLSPSHNLVISLAMEHFYNNTQGQCGVCGVASCIRRGGQIEDDSCCGKTSYDWVYDDPQKPACFSVPRDVPCLDTTVTPPPSPSPCPEGMLCGLLNHPVFSVCNKSVNLDIKKKSCEFDSCRFGVCATLEQAAEECKKAGFCFDWRGLTNGVCDWTCPEGLVYRQCQNKLDDFCYEGKQYQGAALEGNIAGCFCPTGLIRAGNHSNICVSKCYNHNCAPELTVINLTTDSCITSIQMPVCQGQCVSQPRVVMHGDLHVEQKCQCCQERHSERRSVTLQCFDFGAGHYAQNITYNYKHITSCECRACG